MLADDCGGGIKFLRPLDNGTVIGNGVGVRGRVYGDDVPLSMGRHFGHGGGRSIAFVSVVT